MSEKPRSSARMRTMLGRGASAPEPCAPVSDAANSNRAPRLIELRIISALPLRAASKCPRIMNRAERRSNGFRTYRPRGDTAFPRIDRGGYEFCSSYEDGFTLRKAYLGDEND